MSQRKTSYRKKHGAHNNKIQPQEMGVHDETSSDIETSSSFEIKREQSNSFHKKQERNTSNSKHPEEKERNLNDEASDTEEKVSNTSNSWFGGYQPDKTHELLSQFFSIRLFLIVSILAVQVVSLLAVWSVGFIFNENSALQFSEMIGVSAVNRVENYVDRQLDNLKKITQNTAHDYHSFLISEENIHSYYDYSIQRLEKYGLSVSNLAFGENGKDQAYVAFRAIDRETRKIVYAALLKTQDQSNVARRCYLNSKTLELGPCEPQRDYHIPDQDWYLQSMKIIDESGEGYGGPYLVLGTGLELFYSVPVYNRTTLNQENQHAIIGILKINLSLYRMQEFIKTFNVMQNSYIVLSEFNDEKSVIACSINCTVDITKQTALKDIEDRGAGELLSKLYDSEELMDQGTSIGEDANNNTIQANYLDGYMIVSGIYQKQNIKWRISIVFPQSEILSSAILSNYVSVGVTVFVLIVCAIVGIFLAISVTYPLRNLETEFEKLSVMDIESIAYHYSVFREISRIYRSFFYMVNFLREFRSFLPENVMNEIEQQQENTSTNEKQQLERELSKKESESRQKIPTKGSFAANDKGSTNSSHRSGSQFSNSTSKMQSKVSMKDKLFRIGLNSSYSSCLYVQIPNLSPINFTHEDITRLFSKIISHFSKRSKLYNAELDYIKHNEYQIVITNTNNKTNVKALNLALNLRKIINSLNETDSADKPLQLSIGISTSKSYVGTIGTDKLKYSSVIGICVDKAQQLCFANKALGTEILLDEYTIRNQHADDQFLCRAVERYSFDEEVYYQSNYLSRRRVSEMNDGADDPGFQIETIYELVNSKVIEEDEWFYELQQKKKQQQYDVYNELFEMMYRPAYGIQDEGLIEQKLTDCIQRDQNDIPLRRMYENYQYCIENFNSLTPLRDYYYTKFSFDLERHYYPES